MTTTPGVLVRVIIPFTSYPEAAPATTQTATGKFTDVEIPFGTVVMMVRKYRHHNKELKEMERYGSAFKRYLVLHGDKICKISGNWLEPL